MGPAPEALEEAGCCGLGGGLLGSVCEGWDGGYGRTMHVATMLRLISMMLHMEIRWKTQVAFCLELKLVGS